MTKNYFWTIYSISKICDQYQYTSLIIICSYLCCKAFKNLVIDKIKYNCGTNLCEYPKVSC